MTVGEGESKRSRGLVKGVKEGEGLTGKKNVTVGRAEMARSHIDKHGMGLSKVITTT